jgi:hypothetical protein
MYGLAQNLRHAFRQLRKVPAFSLTVLHSSPGHRSNNCDFLLSRRYLASSAELQ